MYYNRVNYFKTPALEFFYGFCDFKVIIWAVLDQTTPVYLFPSPKY